MVGGINGKLTDKGVRSFVNRSAPGDKLTDGRGLYLFITKANGATWRIKYRISGKEKIYSIGTYPQNSLAQARLELTEVKAFLNKGQDPVIARKLNRASAASQSDHTFKAVAEEWFLMKAKDWSSTHLTKSKRAFERDVYKDLGDLPIEGIISSIIATSRDSSFNTLV